MRVELEEIAQREREEAERLVNEANEQAEKERLEAEELER